MTNMPMTMTRVAHRRAAVITRHGRSSTVGNLPPQAPGGHLADGIRTAREYSNAMDGKRPPATGTTVGLRESHGFARGTEQRPGSRAINVLGFTRWLQQPG